MLLDGALERLRPARRHSIPLKGDDARRHSIPLKSDEGLADYPSVLDCEGQVEGRKSRWMHYRSSRSCRTLNSSV